jgi:hypothetical protein
MLNKAKYLKIHRIKLSKMEKKIFTIKFDVCIRRINIRKNNNV